MKNDGERVNTKRISFDRVAEIFDRTRSPPPRVMNKIIDALQEDLEGFKRILDLGIGTGRFAKPLQDVGFEVVGIDISGKMLEKANEKGTANLIMGDITTLPFKPSTFDASISIHTLHLVKNWESALQEMARVTRENLVTILHEAPDHEVTPGGVYRDVLEKYGYLCSHPGLMERRLNEIIKPEKTRLIISYNISAKESIDFLSEKVFAIQWNVPQDLHEKAMNELGEEFTEETKYTNDVYLHKWNISEIKNYLNAKQ